MTISLTTNAAARIKKLLDKNEGAIGLLLGVKTTGCSGLAYTTELIKTTPIDCCLLTTKGIDIFILKEHLQYLNGTTIDYVKEGLQESFKYQNPNAANECGCGESFTVSK